ncbi:hypothetical protein BN1184_AR_01180 [Pantoea ananatis]|nr:hypothetical protein BN1184_AR_01180 [Pantoea ananatis]
MLGAHKLITQQLTVWMYSNGILDKDQPEFLKTPRKICISLSLN